MGITHNIIYYYTKFDIYCGRVYPVPGGWILLTHLSGDGALPSRGALSHVQVWVNPCGARGVLIGYTLLSGTEQRESYLAVSWRDFSPFVRAECVTLPPLSFVLGLTE